MENFKGTQGEWEVDNDIEHPVLHGIWSKHDVPTYIARTCYAPLSKENAQLIAAAPELLEALEDTISCLDRYCIPETSNELKTLYLKSKSAVNKALGIKE